MIPIPIRVIVITCLCFSVAADESDKVTPPLELRFYPLGELATGVLAADDDSSRIIRVPPSEAGFGGYGLGGGQGGFGGGGGSGFSVSDDLEVAPRKASHTEPSDDDECEEVTSQLSLRVYGGPVSVNPRDYQGLVESLSAPLEIEGLITTYIAPESWESNGGKATIRRANHALLVRQTADNHQKIGAFLKQLHASQTGQRTMTLRLWWIPLTDADSLWETLGQSPSLNAGSRLDQLCTEQIGYKAVVQMRAGVPAIIESGAQKLVVTDRVPKVGTGSLGYRTVTELTPVGLTATISGRERTDWEGSGVHLNIETALTAMTSYQAADNERSIDRCDVDRLRLETTCVCQPGQPIVAGQLTRLEPLTAGSGESDDSGRTELCLVVLLDPIPNTAP